MNRRTLTKVGVALLLGGGIAAAIPALPAVAKSSVPSGPLVIQPTGSIGAKGAVAAVKVSVTCSPGYRGFVDLSLTEASHKLITQGFGFANILCTGVTQTITFSVTGYPAVWVPGPAVASADLNAGTVRTQVSAQVKLGNAK